MADIKDFLRSRLDRFKRSVSSGAQSLMQPQAAPPDVISNTPRQQLTPRVQVARSQALPLIRQAQQSFDAARPTNVIQNSIRQGAQKVYQNQVRPFSQIVQQSMAGQRPQDLSSFNSIIDAMPLPVAATTRFVRKPIQTLKPTRILERLNLPRRLPDDDLGSMRDFLDLIRDKAFKPDPRLRQQIELDARRIAERYELGRELSNAQLANKFAKIVDAGGELPQSVRKAGQKYLKDVRGKFKGSAAGKIVPRTESLYGGFAGIEQDEEGNIQFNAQKAALGVVGMAGVTRLPKATRKLIQGRSGQQLSELGQKTALKTTTPLPGAKQTLQTAQRAGIGGIGKPPVPPVSSIPSRGPLGTNQVLKPIKDKVSALYTQALDRFHPLTKAAKQTGQAVDIKQKPGQSAAMRNALTGYYGTGSTANFHIEDQLAPILKRHDADDIRKAAIAFRDLELGQRGIKGSRSQQQAGKVLDEVEQRIGPEFGKLKQTLQELYNYQDNLVQEYLVKTGVMSPEQYAAMRGQNQAYIPFKRVQDTVEELLTGVPQRKGAGSVSKQDVIKGIRGSDRDIVDPLESIVENTYKIVGLGKRQEVARAIVSLADSLPEGTIRKLADAEQVAGDEVISLFQNGKKVRFAVPQEIADAAKGLSEEQLNMLVRMFQVPTSVFRASATGANPEFLFPNVLRDASSAFVNAGANPLGFVRGMARMMKRDDLYKEFLRAGGKTSRVALDRPVIKKTVGQITRKGTGKALEVTKPSQWLKALQTLGEYSEVPTRLNVFEKELTRSIKQGFSREEAIARAAYQAQQATVNFARRGSKTQSLNAVYAFLNARAQGTDRLIRTLKEQPIQASLRLGAASIAPMLVAKGWNSQFESYDDPRVVSERTKRDNFVFMLSDTPIAELGGAQYIKIPKGDIGKFANPVEAFIDYALGQGGDVTKAMKELVLGFAPIDNAGGFIPTAVRPPVEAAVNRNFYTGYDIIPDYKKSFPAGYQDSSYTSPLFRAIGQKLNISPAKLQHLVEGYGTGLARIAEMSSQPFISDAFKTAKNEQGAQINRTPLVRRILGGQTRSEEEQAQVDESRSRAIKQDLGALKNAIKRGEIPFEEGQRQLDELQKELLETEGKPSSQSVGRLDSLYGNVTSISGMKEDTVLQQIAKEKKAYQKMNEIFNDDNASEPDKNAALKALGISPENFQYYQVASLDSADRLAFLDEKVISQVPREQLVEALIPYRKKIAGKYILSGGSSGILQQLVDAGTITKNEKKYLESIEFDEKTGSIKRKPGTTKAKKPKKLNIGKVSSARKPPQIRASRRARRPKTVKLRLSKPKKSGVKTLKAAKFETVEDFKKRLLARR